MVKTLNPEGSGWVWAGRKKTGLQYFQKIITNKNLIIKNNLLGQCFI